MGDPTRVQARGPGLQQTGNVAGKPTYFDIYTAGNENVWERVRATLSLADPHPQREPRSITLVFGLSVVTADRRSPHLKVSPAHTQPSS